LPILHLIKSEIRKRNYLPVLFEFEGPESRDLTETVSTLAHLARFVVADLTDPSCVPHELRTIVPEIQVPVATLISSGSQPYAMFTDLLKYPWLLPPEEYRDAGDVQRRVLPKLLRNAEELARVSRR
jgi:hypothetical protein